MPQQLPPQRPQALCSVPALSFRRSLEHPAGCRPLRRHLHAAVPLPVVDQHVFSAMKRHDLVSPIPDYPCTVGPVVSSMLNIPHFSGIISERIIQQEERFMVQLPTKEWSPLLRQACCVQHLTDETTHTCVLLCNKVYDPLLCCVQNESVVPEKRQHLYPKQDSHRRWPRAGTEDCCTSTAGRPPPRSPMLRAIFPAAAHNNGFLPGQFKKAPSAAHLPRLAFW
jgi:hypothetical protein